MSPVIVITRNGKTTVVTGWRAWLLGGSAMLLAWLGLIVVAVLVVGVGLTIGTLLLLAIPALIGVSLLASVVSRRR